ncbi:hypothetical protein SNEBB_006800 [Seison nebaliae]|nr:hypothetical protein SNEBB_006800 [Seison nebaliae]
MQIIIHRTFQIIIFFNILINITSTEYYYLNNRNGHCNTFDGNQNKISHIRSSSGNIVLPPIKNSNTECFLNFQLHDGYRIRIQFHILKILSCSHSLSIYDGFLKTSARTGLNLCTKSYEDLRQSDWSGEWISKGNTFTVAWIPAKIENSLNEVNLLFVQFKMDTNLNINNNNLRHRTIQRQLKGKSCEELFRARIQSYSLHRRRRRYRRSMNTSDEMQYSIIEDQFNFVIEQNENYFTYDGSDNTYHDYDTDFIDQREIYDESELENYDKSIFDKLLTTTTTTTVQKNLPSIYSSSSSSSILDSDPISTTTTDGKIVERKPFYNEKLIPDRLTTKLFRDKRNNEKFLCTNLRCIDAGLLCDDIDHCGDNSDEVIGCIDHMNSDMFDIRKEKSNLKMGKMSVNSSGLSSSSSSSSSSFLRKEDLFIRFLVKQLLIVVTCLIYN